MTLLEQINAHKERIAELEDAIARERAAMRELVIQFESSLADLRSAAGMVPAAGSGRKPRSIESRFMVVLTRMRNEHPYASNLQAMLQAQAARTAERLKSPIPEAVQKWISEQKPMPAPAAKKGK